MSYDQFVRYKQQLRAITSEFLKTANMLDDDQLEIVVARIVDRVIRSNQISSSKEITCLI